MLLLRVAAVVVSLCSFSAAVGVAGFFATLYVLERMPK